MLRCDWPGCRATLTYDFRLLLPDPKHGWKTEPNMDAYAHGGEASGICDHIGRRSMYLTCSPCQAVNSLLTG